MEWNIQLLPVSIFSSENRHSPSGTVAPLCFLDIIFECNNSITHQESSLLDLGKGTPLSMRKMVRQMPPSLVVPGANG